jgi:hypothetical protein
MDTLEHIVLNAIRSGHLAEADVSKTQLIPSWILYRVVDDIQLNEYSILLREHIIIASEEDNPPCDDFRESLDSWAYRYGVASVSLVSSGPLSAPVLELARDRVIPVYSSIREHPIESAPLVLPFDDANGMFRLARESLEQKMTVEMESMSKLESMAFSYIVDFYCSEEPVIEYELGKEGQRDSGDRGNISRSEGGYDVNHVSTGIQLLSTVEKCTKNTEVKVYHFLAPVIVSFHF